VSRALFALLPLAVSTSACSPDPPADPVPCSAGFLGDAAAPVELDLTAVNPDYVTEPLADGGTISLMQPPQGGQVLFVGLRATNVDSCGLQLTGALRNETTESLTVDSRTINLIPTGDGWGVTGTIGANVVGVVSNFANIPACANHWSASDVDGHEYGLEVTIKDRGGRKGLKTIRVTPECNEPMSAANCVCICRAGYVTGSACPAPSPDGGEAGGGAGAGGGG
jgi:hypothetical protein